jgi:hypothetical protein
MMRHHQMVKNRQQSMLNRAAAEVGLDVDPEYQSRIQGSFPGSFQADYDRSNASLS